MPAHLRTMNSSKPRDDDDDDDGDDDDDDGFRALSDVNNEHDRVPLLKTRRGRRRLRRGGGELGERSKTFHVKYPNLLRCILLIVIIVAVYYVLHVAEMLANHTTEYHRERREGDVLKNDFQAPSEKSVEFIESMRSENGKKDLPKKFFEHMVFEMNHPDDLIRALEGIDENKALKELQEYVKFKEDQRNRESFDKHIEEKNQ